MINSHPPEELLLDFASGGIGSGAGLAVATHLSMCSECRREVSSLMSVGGALLEEIDPAPMETDALDLILSRIDDETLYSDATLGSEARLPHPLSQYIPNGLGGLRWNKVGRWFEEARLSVASSAKVSLLKLKPGALMPQHTHHGQEYTLVLAGGFRDNGIGYGPGDFVVKTPADRHQPRVDDDGMCLCLVVLDGPVRLTGKVGRFLNMFMRP